MRSEEKQVDAPNGNLERGESDEKTLSQFIKESDDDEKLREQLLANSK